MSPLRYPLCVEPTHLFLATNAENTADRYAKGRSANGNRIFLHSHPDQARGEKNGNAKLTDDAVRSIRIAVSAGATKAALGRQYGVSAQCIDKIVTRQKWKHVV